MGSGFLNKVFSLKKTKKAAKFWGLTAFNTPIEI